MAEQHLSGAQFAALEAKMRDAVSAAITSMQLRQYAVKTAVELCLAAGSPEKTMDVAEAIYDFLSQSTHEIVVRIE